MNYEIKEYPFWQSIIKSFSLYLNNSFSILIISFILSSPISLIFYIASNSKSENTTLYYVFLLIFVFVLFFFIMNGFLFKIILRKFATQHNSSIFNQDNFKKVNTKLILTGLINSILVIVILAVSFLLILAITKSTVSSSLFLISILPTTLLIMSIPILLLFSAFSFSQACVIVEKTSVSKSISRSWEISKFERWTIFSHIAIVLLIQLIAFAIFNITFTFFSTSIILRIISNHILITIFNPILSCILVLSYINLKVKKEGFNIEHLAGQFDITRDKNN